MRLVQLPVVGRHGARHVRVAAAAALLPGLLLAGCTVTPRGETALRRRAAIVGRPFERHGVRRHLAPLPAAATPRQLVRYAVANSPAVQEAYWRWRAAIEQIPQAGTQATTLMLSAGTTLQSGRASLANTILGASNMNSADIQWPSKLSAQARAALEAARAAGWRFREAIFNVRRDVLSAWYSYGRTAVMLRLDQQQEQLFRSLAALSRAGISTGRTQPRQWIASQDAIDALHARILALRDALPRRLAKINALLGRSAAAPLAVPAAVGPMRPIAYRAQVLWQMALRRNPALHALRRTAKADRQNIRRAKMGYIPNFDLGFNSSLDGKAQSFTGAVMAPVLRYHAINAWIRQARDQLRATRAALRAKKASLSARLLTDLAALRSDRQQSARLLQRILPRLKIIAAMARTDYQQGLGGIQAQVQAEQAILGVRETLLDLRTDQLTRAADLAAVVAAPLQRRPPEIPAALR